MFDDICRLCCSRNFVNNYIFDEEKSLYSKMSLYLPIKVLRNDELPKKICDECCCKVNDFYQFCNKVIKVQDRLRSFLPITYEEDRNEPVEVIDSKDNILIALQEMSCNQNVHTDPDNNSITYTNTCDNSVKEEQKSPSSTPIHNKDNEQCTTYDFNNIDSDSFEDMMLADLKRIKIRNEQLQLTNDMTVNNNEVGNKQSDNNYLQAVYSLTYNNAIDNSVKEEQNSPCSSPLQDEDDKQNTSYDFDNLDYKSSDDMMLVDLKRIKTRNQGLQLKNCKNINNKVGNIKQSENSNLQAVDSDTYNSTIGNPVKEEEKSPSLSPIHNRCNEHCTTYDFNNIDSDGFEDMMLADLKRIKIRNEQLQLTNVMSVNNTEVENQKHNPGVSVIKKRKNKNRDIRCCICFRRYNNEQTMLTHYRNHVKNMDTQVPQSVPPPLEPASPVCMICKMAVGPAQWERHWRRRHPRPAWRPYRCLVCARSFHTVNSIFKHGKRHARFFNDEFREKTCTGVKCYPCDLCPESFPSLWSLLWHRGRAHPREAYRDPVPHCAHCRAYFNTHRALCLHLLQHLGPRNLCNFCGKTFTSKDYLNIHVLRIHLRVKSNVCKVCKRAFTTKHDLAVHGRVHTGERPYVCGECGRGFTQHSALVVHRRGHTGERPYVCPRCGRGFVSRGLLTMHLKKACSPRDAATTHAHTPTPTPTPTLTKI